jgi:LysM repeat protein
VSEAAIVEVEYIYHTVTAEDTSYWAIAKKYDTTVDAIMELNGLTEPKIYRVGEQMIVGKTTTKKSAPAKQKKSSTKSEAAEYHTITDGDTLGHIALKYNTTVKRLCELNNMEKTDILKLGKKLRVK